MDQPIYDLLFVLDIKNYLLVNVTITLNLVITNVTVMI